MVTLHNNYILSSSNLHIAFKVDLPRFGGITTYDGVTPATFLGGYT